MPLRRRGRILRIVAVILLPLLFLVRPGYAHLRAATFLMRFTSTDTPTGVATFGAYAVDEEDTTLAYPTGLPIPARIYRPHGRADAPGLVLAHGVHYKGIGEPRLQRFARTIASAGVLVMTPELAELADYHIDPRTIDTIGESALDLRKRVHRTSVGVMGLSFAGGLSMLAAADPRYAPAISFVVAVGAHDDLERVSHFFIEDRIPEVGGGSLEMKAHDYGAVVLVYSYVDHFFPQRDVPNARAALRAWLHEDFDGARKTTEAMSAEGKAKMQLVFDHREDVLGREILGIITEHAGAMKQVSPHGNLGGLRARVYLLHGEGDNVIPPAVTRWLAADAPPGSVQNALVSPAIQHVEMHGEPTAKDKYDLVHFMSQVLDDAENESPSLE